MALNYSNTNVHMQMFPRNVCATLPRSKTLFSLRTRVLCKCFRDALAQPVFAWFHVVASAKGFCYFQELSAHIWGRDDSGYDLAQA